MKRLIADKAYDSDPLRKRLKALKIDLICPHRRNRTKAKLQDGRKLRRYRRRWKIERTFSWLGNFRRLVVRWDRLITVYRAFFHLACLIITLRQSPDHRQSRWLEFVNRSKRYLEKIL